MQLDVVDSTESRPVEKGFEQNSVGQSVMTLMAHINYLAQNMHNLAKFVLEEQKQVPVSVQPQPSKEKAVESKGKQLEGQQDPDRRHIQYIARPTEWNTVKAEDAEDTDSEDFYSDDTGQEDSEDEEGGGVQVSQHDHTSDPPKPIQEKGTAISFPFIELYGIELLEVMSLNIIVKCERCKDTTEIKGLKDGISKTVSCKKCAVTMIICFRKDLVHANSVRAGFLDLEGCFTADMLPR